MDYCAACDWSLESCAPDAACCDDCTHGGNWPDRNPPISKTGSVTHA